MKKRICFYISLFIGFFLANHPGAAFDAPAGQESANQWTEEVWVSTVQDAIHPMVSEYLKDLIEKAEKARIRCFIIELDTPGGVLETTREIVHF